jgi:hypothetical protein
MHREIADNPPLGTARLPVVLLPLNHLFCGKGAFAMTRQALNHPNGHRQPPFNIVTMKLLQNVKSTSTENKTKIVQ